jgi:tRNA A-37 threonylcarbamoyl transferase component Bud32
MAGAKVEAFTAVLREGQLLAPEQLDELDALQASFPELRGLAQELVKRGWLTVYQANQLLQGNGRDLVLGPYRILDRLGMGGMGQVFKARHRRMDRIVALKIINQEYLTSPKAVQRFERECRTAAQLSHPNIVLAHDADQVGNIHFLAMEYVEGTDLARLVKQSGPLEVSQACRYVRQAALGLQHAHQQGVVHRDIKPANLMATRPAPGAPAVIKILDFGLARFESEKSESGRLTTLGNLTGTVDFIAPEQVHDARQADGRADIYSLGCTLFFLMTGQPPFPGQDMIVRLSGRLHAPPPSARALRPEVPPQLDEVLAKIMARDPAQRYQTPTDVAAALEPFCRKRKSALPPPVPPADTMAAHVADLQPLLNAAQAAGVATRKEAALPQAGTVPGLEATRPRRGSGGSGRGRDVETGDRSPATADDTAGLSDSGNDVALAPAGGRRWGLWLALGAGAGLLLLGTVILVALCFWPDQPAEHGTTPGSGTAREAVRPPTTAGETRKMAPSTVAKPDPTPVKPPPTTVVRIRPPPNTTPGPKPLPAPPPLLPMDPQPRIGVLFADGSVDEFKKTTDRSMRFGVITRDVADPSGKAAKKLTYNSRGMTNSTVVRFDKKEFTFGATAGRWEVQAAKVGKWGGMKSVWLLDPGLRVTQQVEIIPGELVAGPGGSHRRLLDTCLIRYTLENKDTLVHSVGLRILLDTLIGTNDGVPFTVPGLPGVVDTFWDITPAKSVPDFIQALEVPDLTRPGTVAQMNFKLGGKLEPPGRVSLTHWPTEGQFAWTVPVVAMDNDSAVVIYWNARKMKPGSQRTLGFSYGLGYIATSGGALGVTVGGAFAPGSDLTVVALVSNPRPNENVTLRLPPGLVLTEGNTPTQRVPLAVGSRPSLVTWRVRAGAAGTFTLSVASSTGIEQTKTILIAENPVFGN